MNILHNKFGIHKEPVNLEKCLHPTRDSLHAYHHKQMPQIPQMSSVSMQNSSHLKKQNKKNH